MLVPLPVREAICRGTLEGLPVFAPFCDDNRRVESSIQPTPRRAPVFGRATGPVHTVVLFGLLALYIGCVYVVIVIGGGVLIPAGDALAVLGTVVVALSFQSVRQRAERFANRIVFGELMTPTQAMTELADGVAATFATDDVLNRAARISAEGTGAARADVWLRIGDTFTLSATWPTGNTGQRANDVTMIPGDHVVNVMHGGEALGALTVTAHPGDPLTQNEIRLVDDLGAQLSSILRNVRLSAELQARLEQIAVQAAELRTSRTRIVNAQDEERRRLERDMHDGAQQHLVALAVQLGLAKGLIAQSPAAAAELVAGLRTVTAEAVETLRDLSRGIYPPALTEGGIAEALRAHAGEGGLGITVDSTIEARHPAAIEAAIYFTCLEAIQNSAKYSGGANVTVRISGSEVGIDFEVVDDGGGFDSAIIEPGRGLINMTDRIEAIGGRLDVMSELGRGTVVRGFVASPGSVLPW